MIEETLIRSNTLNSSIVWDDMAKRIIGNCYVSIFLDKGDIQPKDKHKNPGNKNKTEDQMDL